MKLLKKIIFFFYTSLQKEKKEKWDRFLPFNELLIDRKKKAFLIGFGEGSTIHDSSHIYGNVEVGNNTWVGPFTILDGSGGLKIGSNCSISAGVQIYTHDTVDWATSGGKKKYIYKNVCIDDNCYIGPNSVIQKGVKIGKGSVVGANSFVNKSFPENSKLVGNPAKLISK
jgi:acetyltransferase-like isoleucine patch superfamily enzyme